MSRKGSQKDRGNKDFMEKPDEGWSHNTAALAVGKGVYYSFPVRYIGSIQILESLRGLDMSQKIKICWEAINRTCEAAKIKKTKKAEGRQDYREVPRRLAIHQDYGAEDQHVG
jgi:hypothetical protein